MATTPTTPVDTGPVRQDAADPGRAGRIGWIVAGSLATGLIAALLLVAAPFIQVQENDITGAVLWGFAVGWAMLAVLSVRFTDQPQRWAVVPAVFMGVAGLLLVAFGSERQRCAALGVAARAARVGGLDGRAGPPAAAQPQPMAARLPRDRGDGSCLGQRGLTRPCASTWMQARTRWPASWSTSADTGCTCSAPAQEAPPWCCSRGAATCLPSWVG